MADTDITATTDRLFTLIRRTRPAPCDDPALDLITQRASGSWRCPTRSAARNDEQCDALADAFFELEDAIALAPRLGVPRARPRLRGCLPSCSYSRTRMRPSATRRRSPSRCWQRSPPGCTGS